MSSVTAPQNTTGENGHPRSLSPVLLVLCWVMLVGVALLVALGLFLVAWAWREGIVTPPVKRKIPPISWLGLPAGAGCWLLAWTWYQSQRTLRSRRWGPSAAYFFMLPWALTLLIAFLLLHDWLILP